jgi:ankyrin repeat protein
MHITNEADYAQTLQNLIRRAIDSGRGLEEKDGDGRTPLHWAAAIGNQVRCAAWCTSVHARTQKKPTFG